MTDIYQNRRFILQYVIIGVVSIYILRLLYLQIIDKDYQELAKSNVLREVTVFPARGLVHDRNGKLIIDNQKEYDLWVIPGQIKNLDTTGFCGLVGISDTAFRTILQKAGKYSKLKPSIVVKGLSVNQYAAIQEELYLFPGFYGQVRTVRSYPHKSAAHVLGYISEVNQKQIEISDGYYRQGDYIGTGGIEQSYEKQLRGVKGTRFVLVDVHNREQGSFNEGKFDTAAIPGYNMISSIDIELQRYGEDLMKNKIGSIVAIEPQTGEVLSMVSSPAYDPGLLTGQERTRNFRALLTDSLKPLFVRPLKAAYPPGSTYKASLALVALQSGGINYNTTYSCPGAYYVGSFRVGCHHSGFVPNVIIAIQYSCNSYFCNSFRHLVDDDQFTTVSDGVDYWKKMLASMGIGIKTGIDLPSEGYGFVPSSAYYDKVYGKKGWHSVTIVSLGIGQGEIGETPLQMANGMAAIANKGYWFTPHLVKKIEGNDSVLRKNVIRHVVPIDTSYFSMVIYGLERVVEAGTATVAQIPGVTTAGKTGTAQNPHGEDHSVFVAFAPIDDPKIAIAVVVENAGWGGSFAAPIASLLIEKYLNDTISTPRKYLEERMMNAIILPVNYRPLRKPNQGIDWMLVLLFICLVIIGWLAIFASTYDEAQPSIFDLDKSYGRQFLWIIGSILLGGAILLTDSKFYTTFAYIIYGFVVLLLAAVFVIGTTVKGDTNWINIGSFQLQPSEFAKFAANLALAKFMSQLNFNMKDLRTRFTAMGIFGVPAILVLLQGDAGSAVIFLSFLLLLFRFGLPGSYLWLGVYVIALSVFAFIVDKTLLILILFFITGILLYIARKNRTVMFIVLASLVFSAVYVFTMGYVFEQVLETHQQDRIKVLLGDKVDVKDADYNVRQSKIAIGSGGMWGKGFLKGTLTKYNFVPEQSTDFIYCTIGEEYGFIGSTLLLLLFLALLLRILFIAQRQRSRFSMIYAYGVAALIFFHVMINVGMTIGLMPVIGIPLPFISYGGSSLWSFTIFLFILIKLDADRLAILR